MGMGMTTPSKAVDGVRGDRGVASIYDVLSVNIEPKKINHTKDNP